MYVPTRDKPEAEKRVPLSCPRCRKSCGEWKARTVLDRVNRRQPWVD